MATLKVKNNAIGYLSTAISASDVGVALESGDGAAFPALSTGDYFYATLEDTNGVTEVVKVTARSGDSLTIERAQEGTTAATFAAGSAIELRITAQNVIDLAATQGFASVLATSNTWTAEQTIDAVLSVYGGSKLKLYNSSDANPHGIANVANVLTFDYNGTAYLTVSAAGIVSFVNSPTIGGSYIYRDGGTDIPITDGGTGASTAAGARTNLGLVIGTDVLAYSAFLSSVAGLTHVADKLAYTSASNTAALTDFPAFGRTLVANASAADARSDLGLGTMSTQAASAVAITGGTISGVTALHARRKVSSEASGTLTALSANALVQMTGNVQLDGGVFTEGDVIYLYAGASSRTVTQGTSMTLRLGGSATTGSRTLAARTFAQALVVGANEIVITGTGVS